MTTTLLQRAGHRAAVALLFEPRDLWMGAYWDTYWEGPHKTLDVYLCVIPMLPVRISMQVRSLV
jgi:hypothetical protein